MKFQTLSWVLMISGLGFVSTASAQDVSYQSVRESISSSYPGYQQVYLGSVVHNPDLDTSALAEQKCKKDQLQAVANLTAKTASELKVDPIALGNSIQVSTRSWYQFRTGMGGHMSQVGQQYDYYCATDLTLSAPNYKFIKRVYEVNMEDKHDTETCEAFVKGLSNRQGFITASYETSKVARNAWMCEVTSMSIGFVD